jgi:hypothetical protein
MLTTRIGCDKGDPSLEVFRISVSLHHLWTVIGAQAPLQNTICLAGERIRGDPIGEWELVARIKVILMITRVAAWLCEAVVDVGLA